MTLRPDDFCRGFLFVYSLGDIVLVVVAVDVLFELFESLPRAGLTPRAGAEAMTREDGYVSGTT
jgi:hypothetical protein